MASNNRTCEPYLDLPNINLSIYVYELLGDRCSPPAITIPTVVVYALILVVGIVGNLSTCIVIVRNRYMHSATNFYLCSLSISDLLMLSIGLPMELYSLFDVAYPYRFGEFICKLRAFLVEFTSYASILTITAFSIERWLAICFPLRVRLFSSLHRAVKLISFVWALAFIAAAPMAFYVIVNRLPMPEFALNQSWTSDASAAADNSIHGDYRHTIRDTDYCALDSDSPDAQHILIQTAFWIFFAVPMTLILVLYVHIAIRLRTADRYLRRSGDLLVRSAKSQRTRKSVLRVLVAVVLAFFVCWLPFHAQRLLTVMIDSTQLSATTHSIFNFIFYFSGYFYYANSCINPILYNSLSGKYRRAFCRTMFPHTIARRLNHTSSVDKYFATRRSPTNCGGGGIVTIGHASGDVTNSVCAPSIVRRNNILLDVPPTAAASHSHHINGHHCRSDDRRKSSIIIDNRQRRPVASFNEISKIGQQANILLQPGHHHRQQLRLDGFSQK